MTADPFHIAQKWSSKSPEKLKLIGACRLRPRLISAL